MQGKNILVTGASQGIGYGVALRLLERGANVIMVARNKEKMDELAKQYPDTAYVYPFDLNELDQIENLFLFCKEKDMKLDGMVHAAGIMGDCPVKSVDVSFMENVLRLNYMSYVQLGRYFSLKKYSNNGASVVAISSNASFANAKGMSQYSASKIAVNSYTITMAKEVAKREIRVNAIAPGFVDTQMVKEMRKIVGNFDEKLMQMQPFGVIPVAQIADLVEFLLSSNSQYITGAVIPITGGAS